MMDELIVPLPFTGLDIQRDYPAGKQIVTVAIAAVVVTGRVLDGKVNMSQFRILISGPIPRNCR